MHETQNNNMHETKDAKKSGVYATAHAVVTYYEVRTIDYSLGGVKTKNKEL